MTLMKQCPISYLFFFILILIIIPVGVYSQEKTTHISGKILSQETKPLTNCNVIIQAESNSRLMAYTTTGEGNEFNLLLHWNHPDSVLITISHVGYKTERIKTFIIPGGSYHWNIMLISDPKKLEDVTVTAPPISKHGDTTSYNVAFFTEPTDIKLIDVINNMPGFKVDDNGIYFKGKKIKKITLDNEDLFADKINLLTKNLPVDRIKTIQALENQNMNQKLKGLTGDDEVFINLVTKKNTISFGDIEAGAGTLGRYKVNPVLFQLRNKIKAGLIADWDNSGKTMSPGDDYQLKGDEYENVIAGSIKGTGIFIPNFNQSRYVKNHLGDARFSLNWRVSRSLKSNTEISFIKDNRLQSSNENSQILSADSLIQRSAINRVNIRPVYLQVADQISWDISKNAALQTKFIFAADYSQYEENKEITQNNFPYSSAGVIKNNWNTFFAHADFTNRLSVRKALEIQTHLGLFYLPQILNSLSPNWPTLFNLPDSSYQQFYQPYSNKIFSLKTTVNYIVRKGKRLFTYNLTGEYKRLNSLTTLDFISMSGAPAVKYEMLSGKGIYSQKSISSDFNYSFYFAKLLFSTSVTAGVAEITTDESPVEKNYLMPVLKFRISQKSKIFKELDNRFEIKYEQIPWNVYSYRSKIYPTGIAIFEQKKNFGLPEKEMLFSHDINFFTIGTSSLFFSQSLGLNFTNHITTPSNNGIVFISTDSVMSNRITKNYLNRLTYVFPIIFLKTKCTVSGGIGFSESFINTGNKIEWNFFDLKNLSVELQRNWKRKVYFTLKSDISFINNHLPVNAGSSGFKPTLNLLNTLSLKTKIASTLESKITADFIQNNISNPQSVSAVFADCELVKTFKKNKISLRLKLENIFDQKQYLVVNRYLAVYQSVYTIPLIRRNLLCTVRIGL